MSRAVLVPLLLSLVPIANGAPLEYTATPVALVVAPPNKHPNFRPYRLGPRSIKYSEIVRPPQYYAPGATVHCAETKWLGVVLLVEKSRMQLRRQTTDSIRHVWSHHGSGESPPGVETAWSLPITGYSTQVLNYARFELEEQFKVDGVWTVRSYIDGELVAEQPFNLIDCAGELESIAIPELPEPAPGAPETEPEPEPEKIVCSREKLTGSNIKTTVCRTESDIDRRRESDQDMIRDVQTAPRRNIPE